MTLSARQIMAVSATVTLWIGVTACQAVAEFPHREDYALLRSVGVGATAADVRAKLGEPNFVYGPGTKPEEYCVAGRACTNRVVSGQLLIFIHGKPTGFYFLDSSGRVEFVYVGGA